MGRPTSVAVFAPPVPTHIPAWEYRTLLLNDAVQWVSGDVGKPSMAPSMPQTGVAGEPLRTATNTYAHHNYRFAFEPRYRTRIPPDEDQRLQDYFYEYGPPKRFMYELSANALHNVDSWRARTRQERADRRRHYKPNQRYLKLRKTKTCAPSTSQKHDIEGPMSTIS